MTFGCNYPHKVVVVQVGKLLMQGVLLTDACGCLMSSATLGCWELNSFGFF